MLTALTIYVNQIDFIVMGGCLKTCCASEGGLRCHSVLTICGFTYFTLMFIIFQRQENYFEFEVKDPQGTRWACLFSALLFLLWFFVTITQIMKIEEQGQRVGNKKIKISLSEIKFTDRKIMAKEGEEERLIDQ